MVSVHEQFAPNCLYSMSISESSLKEFQKLYKQEFEKDISMDEARQLASNLLLIVNTIIHDS
jgi:hypothetical protein